MTIQAAGLILLVCLCSGMLLGSVLAVRAVQPKRRRLAEERRRLDAHWRAVRKLEQQAEPVRCPRCGWLLSEEACYPEEDDEPDDD